MAKGPWLRDPLTGLSAEVDIDFSEARRLGCDLFDVTSIAPLFGIAKVRYFRDEVVPRARAIGVHFVELRTHTGSDLVGYATCISSAQKGGEMWRAHRNARLSEIVTNPSGGSIG